MFQVDCHELLEVRRQYSLDEDGEKSRFLAPYCRLAKMIRHRCSDRIDWGTCLAKHNHIQRLALTTTVKAKNPCVASLFAPSYWPKVPFITSIRAVAEQTHFPIGVFRLDVVVVEQL